MSKMHFFTESDLLSIQTTSQAFGPVTASNGYDRFRVTSLHSSTGSPNAYAIFDGVVCVQPVNGSTTVVNLILKPEKHSNIPFTPIRYIIYKGIVKTSLFDGSGNIANISGNDLTTSIYDSQNALNESYDFLNGNPPGTTTDLPTEDVLGINLNSSVTEFSDTDPIDNLFFQSSSSIQFPSVKGGWLLGEFDPGQFGIELVAESIYYNPTLALTRVIENYVSVAQLPNTPTDSQVFKHWHDKENVLYFIDACAYYGLQYNDQLQIKTSTSGFSPKHGNDIYNEALISFANKNVIYLDIRNEHNHSLNYYKNYGTDINIAYDASSSPQSEDYYGSGWPLFIINTSSFPIGNTSNKNTIRLAFPSGDNNYPLLNIETAYINQGKPYRVLKNQRRFFELLNEEGSGFTNEIGFIVPNDSSASGTTPISSYVKLRYLKKDNFNQDISSDTVFRNSLFLDNIFAPFLMNIPFPSTSGIKVRVYGEEFFVDVTADNGSSYMAKIGIAEDADTYTFFALPSAYFKTGVKKNVNPVGFSSIAIEDSSSFLAYLLNRFHSDEVKTNRLNFSSDYADIAMLEPARTISLNMLHYTSLEFMTVIVIKKAALSTYISLASTGGLSSDYKVVFGINNPSTETAVDDFGKSYRSYDLLLRGYHDESGIVEISEVSTTQKIYSYVNS